MFRSWISPSCHRSSLNAFQLQLRRTSRYQSTTAFTAHSISPALLGRARSISAEHAKLSQFLSTNYEVAVARKVGELSATVEALASWESAQKSVSELEELLRDPSIDTELRTLAAEDIESTTQSLDQLSHQLRQSLIPPHPFAALPCLLEIRPGNGGSEAGLFAGDLLRMYQAFCKRRGLRSSLLKLDDAPSLGSNKEVQEAVLEVEATGAYDLLRCEAGVHRVQRVPATESKGRTHTSSVAVMVLPSFLNEGAEDLGESNFKDPSSDYFIDPKDVKSEVMRAGGAGGQHVNMTESAVRLTHIPTNTVVSMQDSRSQHQNREKAWRFLRAKLAQARREAREEEISMLRANVVGIAKMGSSYKIRTYNWSQQRVTDHRSGLTLNQLDDILEGGESLDKVMDSVKCWFRERDAESLVTNEEPVPIKPASKSK